MTTPTCPKCGATLPAEGATCRRCLMELAASWKPEAGAEPVSTHPPKPGKPPPEPAELAPLFPELELVRLLGVGGMGAVYEARQKRLGRAVALKVLHDELGGDPLFVERFLREAQALAKLAHPGIVAIHDFGEREKRCYLVMEYVDGANLRALLKQGLLAPRQALDIVRQLCDALQFAHDEGVVHRDIKPENVLVDTTGRVKIADFGLAKLVGVPAQLTLTSAGQVMGTPHYMAPEQVERPRDVDHRADLYSLGVVFYEMLTGELPLGRFQPPSERVQIDVRLDEIVLKSLERERERRYQHAVQVKTDVERVEKEPARARKRHPLLVRSGVYLPRLQAAFGRHRPRAWGWLALATLAWIACGASFDLGPTGFWLLSVPLTTWMFLSLVAARAGVEPTSDEQVGPYIVRMSPTAFVLAASGFVLLFVTHFSSWERGTPGYVSSSQEPMAMLERWRGAEVQLLQHVYKDAFLPAPGEARLEPISTHWTTVPDALLAVHPLLLGALAGVFLVVGAALAARGRARPAAEWRASVAGSMALFLLPLAGLHGLTFAIHGGSELEGLQLTQKCQGTAEYLGEKLYRSLVADGLHVHVEHSARIVSLTNGGPLFGDLATVHILAAAPSSVFARWRITWAGPQRLQPHVVFTVVSNAGNQHAAILADGGLVELEQRASGGWPDRLQQLLASACEARDSK